MIWKKTRYLDSNELAVLIDGRKYCNNLAKAVKHVDGKVSF